MSLSCTCDHDLSIYDVSWLWCWPSDYTTLTTKRAKRCCSCNRLIKPGETVAAYERERAPVSAIEERIHGDGEPVPLAAWYHCEICADLAASLEALGFCFQIDDDMRALVRSYAENYGRP